MATPDEPAFPTEQITRHVGAPGITVRDYFAAAALTGMCANPNGWGVSDQRVAAAYALADAMLAARGAA